VQAPTPVAAPRGVLSMPGVPSGAGGSGVLGMLAVLVLLLSACTGGSGSGGPSATQASPSGAAGKRVVADMPVWHARAEIDTPRDDFAHVAVGNEIWTFGGMTGDRGNRLSTTEVYNTATNTWRYGPQMPEGLCSFEGAAVGDRIYLFGGFDEDFHPSDFSAVLDTSTGRWKDLPPLPHARYSHDVAEVGGKIYVIGGDGNKPSVSAVDVFDPRTNTWSHGAPMPQARASIDLAPVGNVLYVLGGWLGNGPTAKVQTYNTATDTWGESTPMPKPMSRGGAAAVDGRIFVSYHEFSAVYDVRNHTWSPANPMTVARHGLGYIAVGEKIYGIAGCTEHPLRDVSYVDVLDVSSV
jgi:Kelch motif/Galactose oxidase, central domain